MMPYRIYQTPCPDLLSAGFSSTVDSIVNAAVELNNFLNILLGTDCCMDSYRSIQRPKTNGMTEQSKA